MLGSIPQGDTRSELPLLANGLPPAFGGALRNANRENENTFNQ